MEFLKPGRITPVEIPRIACHPLPEGRIAIHITNIGNLYLNIAEAEILSEQIQEATRRSAAALAIAKEGNG